MKITLETCQVENAEFVHVLAFIGQQLAPVTQSGTSIIAFEQDLHWFGGRIDRLAITEALVKGDGGKPETRRIIGLDQEVALRCAAIILGIQSATSLNTPLNVTCMEISAAEGEAERVDARALFLSGAVLVLPGDDFALERDLRDAHDDRTVFHARLLLPPAASHHAEMHNAGLAQEAADLIIAMLDRPEEISVEIQRGDPL